MLDKLERFMTRATQAVLVVFMSLMTLLVFAQVVSRYLIGMTPFFIEEVSRGLLVWLACFGSSLAVRSSQHVGVDFFVERLPVNARRSAKKLARSCVLSFLLFFLFASAKYSVVQLGQQSATLPISMFWFYLALPVGSALMILQLLFQMSAKEP